MRENWELGLTLRVGELPSFFRMVGRHSGCGVLFWDYTSRPLYKAELTVEVLEQGIT